MDACCRRALGSIYSDLQRNVEASVSYLVVCSWLRFSASFFIRCVILHAEVMAPMRDSRRTEIVWECSRYADIAVWVYGETELSTLGRAIAFIGNCI